MAPNQINLDIRVPVKSLKALENIFIGNPHRHTTAEISEAANVSKKYARELKLLHSRRPDLAELVFKDELSLYKAAFLMRQDPDKWQEQKRTRL